MARLKSYEKYDDRIYCANCGNAKTILCPNTRTKTLTKKVKCKKGCWVVNKANGKGGICDYHAVWRRQFHKCPNYESMGDNDLGDFLDSLPRCKEDMGMPGVIHAR